METILLRGKSKENTNLIIQLAKKLKFEARKLSLEDVEEMGIWLSIDEGLESGLLSDTEKDEFLSNLNESGGNED